MIRARRSSARPISPMATGGSRAEPPRIARRRAISARAMTPRPAFSTSTPATTTPPSAASSHPTGGTPTSPASGRTDTRIRITTPSISQIQMGIAPKPKARSLSSKAPANPEGEESEGRMGVAGMDSPKTIKLSIWSPSRQLTQRQRLERGWVCALLAHWGSLLTLYSALLLLEIVGHETLAQGKPRSNMMQEWPNWRQRLQEEGNNLPEVVRPLPLQAMKKAHRHPQEKCRRK